MGYSAVHIPWKGDMYPVDPVYAGFINIVALPSTRSGILPMAICLTVNISVNLVIVRCPGKLDFFECYLGTTYPRTSDIYFAAGR